jgi:3-oxoacyl-(acyl-carrier-protein) synthase
VEAQALALVFGAARPLVTSITRPLVTSIKGAIGEFGASGAASCAAAFLCGAQGEVPPIAGLTEVDDAASGLNLARARQPAPGPIVLVNSTASGGSLFSVVLHVARH